MVTDHLGSIVGLFNSGVLESTRAYDPWGQVRSTTGEFISIGYAGGETSHLDGLVKFGAHYYDPTLGVFTHMDPAGQEQNPYLDAEADRINNQDPTGLSTLEDINQFIGIMGACGGIGMKGAMHGGIAGGVTPILGNAGGAALGGLAGCAAGAILELETGAMTGSLPGG